MAEIESWDDESWRRLRGAMYRGDGGEIVDVLVHHDPLEVAQIAGEGLLIALGQGIEEAVEPARRLADEMRERFLPVDDVLAQQLDAALGVASPPDLKPIDVDLDQLSSQIEGEGDPEGFRLDVNTGQLWFKDPIGVGGIEPPDYWEDPDQWIEVYGTGSRAGWQDMSDFIRSVEDRHVAERLEEAIRGRGAFRRFRDIVFNDEDLGPAWRRFSDTRERGRARAWLAERGYQVLPYSGE